ncbi:MAG: replicative DNA helicase [Acidiferrobacterales bacterium]
MIPTTTMGAPIARALDMDEATLSEPTTNAPPPDLDAEVQAGTPSTRHKPKPMRLAKEVAAGYIDILEQRFRGEVHHVPTGLADLDEIAPGALSEGHLIIMAARPGMGKTTLAQQMTEMVAEQNRTALFFSLEMSDYEIAERAFVRRGKVPMRALRSGELTESDWRGVGEAIKGFSPLPLIIDDKSFSLPDIIKNARAAAGALEKKGLPKLGLITIDYLQLIASPGAANRNLEIGTITRGLKMLAKELSTPIMLLSQLNREVEHRSDHRPTLADLRESGNIEQDADLVVFIYRDDVYNEDSHDAGTAEILIRKNRHGATGKVRLAFLADRLEFANYTIAGGINEVWVGDGAGFPAVMEGPTATPTAVSTAAADEQMMRNAATQAHKEWNNGPVV